MYVLTHHAQWLEVGTVGLLGLDPDVQLLAPEDQLLVLLHHLVILELLQVNLVWQPNLLILEIYCFNTVFTMLNFPN